MTIRLSRHMNRTLRTEVEGHQHCGRRRGRAALAAALLAACGPSLWAQGTQASNAVDAWRRDLPGIRSTERQLEASAPSASDADHRQRLVIRTVQPAAAPAGLYLYVERARLAQLHRPLMQEVWRVTAVGPRVKVERFGLKVPARFVGAHSSDGLMSRLGLDDLDPRKGCDLLFTAREDRWEGATAGRGCASSTAGATYARLRLTWDAEHLTFDERGLDASDREVTSPPNGAPYDFTPEQPLEATR